MIGVECPRNCGKTCFCRHASAGGNAELPEFTLPTQEGHTVNLKDFRGKWVVLYFYPKDITPGCTIEAHNFQRDQDRIPGKVPWCWA